MIRACIQAVAGAIGLVIAYGVGRRLSPAAEASGLNSNKPKGLCAETSRIDAELLVMVNSCLNLVKEGIAL
jgi:hypothetical protein